MVVKGYIPFSVWLFGRKKFLMVQKYSHFENEEMVIYWTISSFSELVIEKYKIKVKLKSKKVFCIRNPFLSLELQFFLPNKYEVHHFFKILSRINKINYSYIKINKLNKIIINNSQS